MNNNILKNINYKSVEYIESPNRSSLKKVNFIIVHYTASMASGKGIALYFSKPSAKVSAHFVIGFDGEIYQCVPLNYAAWHAGRSKWLNYKGLNRYSIGIEVCNPGPLTKVNEYTYKTWNGRIVKIQDKDSVIEKTHPITRQKHYWMLFNEKQLESLIELGNELSNKFEILDVLGHDMISPFRKIDPGPCIDPKIYETMMNERKTDKYAFEGTKVYVKNAYEYIIPADNTLDDAIYKIHTIKKGKIVNRIGYWFELTYNKQTFYSRVSDVYV